jgi:hypothetical protein
VVVAAIGVGVVVSTKDHADEGAAGINPTVVPTGVPTLSTDDIGPQAQRWLENTADPVLHGSGSEISCARVFASGRPNPQLRLVQPAKVNGRRATVIGLQGGSPRDIQLFVVTGCSEPGGVASPFYDTTVTLRNR